MFLLILGIIFAIGAIFALVSFKQYAGVKLGAALGLGLATVLVIGSFTTAIPAKRVGVVSSFGKVSEDTLNPGLNFRLPWQKVTEIDATRQTDEFTGDTVLTPRIGDGSTAYVEATIRWEINPAYANVIYADFRSDDPTESFKQAVITTQLKASAQKVLEGYNPIAALKTVNADEAASATDLSFAPDYDATAKAIEDDMKARLGDEPLANIISVTVSYVGLSDTTQKKLDDYIAAVGETRIAQQRSETAAAQAKANRELSASVSNDPNVLVSKCYDIVAEAQESNYQLPAGFSCWPGGSANGLLLGTNNPSSEK